MNDASDRRLRAWVVVIGLLAIVALGVFSIAQSLRMNLQQAQQMIQPVNEISNNLGTQIARVLNPTPTVIPDPVTIIYQVRSLARLETIQYSVEKVITAETGQGVFGPFFGDRLLLVAHGKIIAGVDLAKLTPENLRIKDGVLYVTLPEPELFVVVLDNDKSYVYDRDTGLLTRGDIHLETAARRAAEEAIRSAALDDGILEQAQRNAENFLYRLLRDLGFSEVIFEESSQTP